MECSIYKGGKIMTIIRVTKEQVVNAKKAKVKKLILTHISARYKDTTILLEQAQKIFKNTQIAEDFTNIEIPLLNS